MKKKIIIGVLVLVVLLGAGAAWVILVGNKRSPEKTESFTMGDTQIQVTYCQPFKKGRLIFGEEKDKALVPYGKYWRLGANAATQISFSTDVSFGDQPVKAGTYRMYAVPGPSTWSVVLNSELGKWGAMEPDYSLDVVKTEAPVFTGADELEQFTITFSTDSVQANVNFGWDKTRVSVPIKK